MAQWDPARGVRQSRLRLLVKDGAAESADAGLHGITTWDGPGPLTARGQSAVRGHVEFGESKRLVHTSGCYPVRDRHRTRPSVFNGVEHPTKMCVSEREAQLGRSITLPTHTKNKKR